MAYLIKINNEIYTFDSSNHLNSLNKTEVEESDFSNGFTDLGLLSKISDKSYQLLYFSNIENESHVSISRHTNIPTKIDIERSGEILVSDYASDTDISYPIDIDKFDIGDNIIDIYIGESRDFHFSYNIIREDRDTFKLYRRFDRDSRYNNDLEVSLGSGVNIDIRNRIVYLDIPKTIITNIANGEPIITQDPVIGSKSVTISNDGIVETTIDSGEEIIN